MVSRTTFILLVACLVGDVYNSQKNEELPKATQTAKFWEMYTRSIGEIYCAVATAKYRCRRPRPQPVQKPSNAVFDDSFFFGDGKPAGKGNPRHEPSSDDAVASHYYAMTRGENVNATLPASGANPGGATNPAGATNPGGYTKADVAAVAAMTGMSGSYMCSICMKFTELVMIEKLVDDADKVVKLCVEKDPIKMIRDICMQVDKFLKDHKNLTPRKVCESLLLCKKE